MSTEAPKTTKYELSTGGIAVLGEILPTVQWYKDEAKQGQLICRAFAANEALPEVAERPKPEKDELKDSFDPKVEKWAEPILSFEWTDKQKDAVKVCVRFYLKQGAFTVTTHTVKLLELLGLDDE